MSAMIPLVFVLLLLQAAPAGTPTTEPTLSPIVIQSGMNPYLIAAMAVGSPLLLLLMREYVDGRKERRSAAVRRDEKKEDWARQDEVAKRVDEVARLAAESEHRMTAQLSEIKDQGKKIHILVNSDMTAARTAERDAMRMLTVSLKQQVAIGDRTGVPASDELRDAIERSEARVEELDVILADRLAAQKKVEASS